MPALRLGLAPSLLAVGVRRNRGFQKKKIGAPLDASVKWCVVALVPGGADCRPSACHISYGNIFVTATY